MPTFTRDSIRFAMTIANANAKGGVHLGVGLGGFVEVGDQVDAVLWLLEPGEDHLGAWDVLLGVLFDDGDHTVMHRRNKRKGG